MNQIENNKKTLTVDQVVLKINKVMKKLNLAVLLFSIVLGVMYFIWYIFYGYDSESRVLFIDEIKGIVDIEYLWINENSPFFLFNFSILIIIIILMLSFFTPAMEWVYRKITKKNYSNYEKAMNLIFSEGVYRFDPDRFGWAERETLTHRIENFLKAPHNLLYFVLKRYIPNSIITKIFEKIVFYVNIDCIENALLKALNYLGNVKSDDENYGEAQYYMALIYESLYLRRDTDEDSYAHYYSLVNILLMRAIEFNVNLAEYQLAMHKLQFIDQFLRSPDLLRDDFRALIESALRKIPGDRVDLKNNCYIVMVVDLAKSENLSELTRAIEILDKIDKKDKYSVKIEKNEFFIRNPLAPRVRNLDDLENNLKGFPGGLFKNGYLNKIDIYNRSSTLLNWYSLSGLQNTLSMKIDVARKKELYMAAEEEKRKATENLMAMFAHKFRGPVDSIIFNTQHKHDERIYLDAARTMTGLLEIFSIVSTEPEMLIDSMKSDVSGDGCPQKTILRSMKLALMQLLTQRNIKRMSRHYWQHALSHALIPDSTRFKEWNSQPHLSILEKEIQEKLEMEVSSLSIENGVEEIETWMRSNLMATEIQVSDARQIRYSVYGRKEALLITIMTELFVNAIKHTDATSTQPLIISWDEQADALVFKCTNPSNRESRSGLSRGSGRGHSFLKMLLEKMQGQFQPDVYQELSVVSVVIPYNLLIGERS